MQDESARVASASEGIVRVLKSVEGPQGCGKASRWVSDCLRWGNEGLKTYYKDFIKGGEILKCCEVFNGRGERKKRKQKQNGEIVMCVSTIGHGTPQCRLPKRKSINSF